MYDNHGKGKGSAPRMLLWPRRLRLVVFFRSPGVYAWESGGQPAFLSRALARP